MHSVQPFEPRDGRGCAPGKCCAAKGFEEANAAMSLLKRFGTSDEVAKLARFLLSDDSAYIIGAEILIDGGVSLT
ncbi:MAG: SDR family oxidoreductase [Verrucomicrobiota bacterium]|nr:SDR family oxidoreductase [Verrucomicrobiota bacterium]